MVTIRILKRVISNVKTKKEYNEITRKFENGEISKEEKKREEKLFLQNYNLNRKENKTYPFMKYEL